LREYVNGDKERYLTTQHERDNETGLDYRGARYYDSDVARFLSLDPLASEFPEWSDYCYVAGNPIIFIDPDGRYFVGVDGEKVKIRRRKGQLVIKSGNASSDLVELISSVNSSGSKTANKQIRKASRNKTMIHVQIETAVVNNGLLGLHQAHDKDGNVLTWDSNKGDFNGTPAYVKKGVYKEATITIFKGNIEQSGGNGGHYGWNITTSQEMANTFQHETHHDTDKEFIQDLRNKREGKPNKGIDPHENIHPQEQKVYEEMDNRNKAT